MPNRIVRNRSNVKAGSAADDLAEYISAVHRTVHAFGLYFDSLLEGKVTQPEAVVLLHLARHGESTINDVHRAFLHKRSTLTSVVDRLERKSLVRRRIGESDRRNFTLVLSAQGARTAQQILQAVTQLHMSIDADPSALRATTALLDQTTRSLAS